MNNKKAIYQVLYLRLNNTKLPQNKTNVSKKISLKITPG